MGGMATASKVVAHPKEYRVGDVCYGIVSAQAMRFIEAARTKCGNDKSIELLQIAACEEGVSDENLVCFVVYGRFELDLSPKVLGNFARENGLDPRRRAAILQNVFGRGRLYREKAGLQTPKN